MSRDQRARLRNRKIGFVFQNFNLLSRTSAQENVELPLLYSRRFRGRQRRQRVRQLLEKVGLEPRWITIPRSFPAASSNAWPSPGPWPTSRRFSWPTSPPGNLDSHTSREVMELFRQLNRDDGITIILVTHDEDVARHARRTVALRDGQVIGDSTDFSRATESCTVTSAGCARSRTPCTFREDRICETSFLLADRRHGGPGRRHRGLQLFLWPRERATPAANIARPPAGRGDIIFSVPSTGTVQPVLSVQVGSFVSGPDQDGPRRLQRPRSRRGSSWPRSIRCFSRPSAIQAKAALDLRQRQSVAGRGQARTGRARLEAGPEPSPRRRPSPTPITIWPRPRTKRPRRRGGGQGHHRAEQGRLETGRNQPRLHRSSRRRSMAWSPTGKSTRGRPWPRSFKRP